METAWTIFLDFWIKAKTLFAGLRPDALLLGFITGKACAFVGWGKQRRYLPRLLQDAAGASSTLIVLASLLTGVYMFVSVSRTDFLFAVLLFALGAFICTIFRFFLNALELPGGLLDAFFAVIAGPSLIVSLWFFHTGELLRQTVRFIERLTDFF